MISLREKHENMQDMRIRGLDNPKILDAIARGNAAQQLRQEKPDLDRNSVEYKKGNNALCSKNN